MDTSVKTKPNLKISKFIPMKKIIFISALALSAGFNAVLASSSPSNTKCIKRVYTVKQTIDNEEIFYYFTYHENAVIFYNYHVNDGLGGVWSFVGPQTVDCSVYTIDLP
ncbi:hypothetical protein IW16_11795 [Chryseobacterium vrystaatense]|uniref:Beta/Gamma crystallin n=1 Tax=Chryseobacterium vrystaatense TaxID=307480 RepID=A0ABR4UNR3_9FLAO|nr:hypothetical protein IW16_11795 [Chryseobacterium vrystaatense]